MDLHMLNRTVEYYNFVTFGNVVILLCNIV